MTTNEFISFYCITTMGLANTVYRVIFGVEKVPKINYIRILQLAEIYKHVHVRFHEESFLLLR